MTDEKTATAPINLTPEKFGTNATILLTVVLVAMICLYLYRFHAGLSNNQEHWGQFGDFIGGVLNPLVSFLVLSVAFQVWQLQERDLKATKTALEEQAKTIEKQRQEERFFDLLNLYLRTLDSITLTEYVSGSHGYYKGKEAIKEWMKREAHVGKHFLEFLRHGIGHRYHASNLVEITADSLQNEWRTRTEFREFDHYFRVIYRILKESEKLLGAEHFYYVKLLRAQMTEHELTLVAMNLWFDEEGEKMRDLVKKYGLLKHLPPNKFREAFTNKSGISPDVYGKSYVSSGGAIC